MVYSIWTAKAGGEKGNESYRRVGGDYSRFDDAAKAMLHEIVSADKGTKVKMVATKQV